MLEQIEFDFSENNFHATTDVVRYNGFEIDISFDGEYYRCSVHGFGYWSKPIKTYEWMMYQIQRKIDIFRGDLEVYGNKELEQMKNTNTIAME
jgi:hypothetical protein